MAVLLGDINGDAVVNATDAKKNFHNGDVPNANTFRLDVNLDGVLNDADIQIAKAQKGTSLPH